VTRNLGENPAELLIGNIFAYCGNNPVIYTDVSGMWFGIDDAFTGPVDEIIVLGVLAILATCGVEWASDAQDEIWDVITDAWDSVKSLSSYIKDWISEARQGPVGKAGRKKQGREVNEKKRRDDDWIPRSNKDPNRPMKKHTPGRDYRIRKKR